LAPDDIELGYRLRPSAWGRGYATEGSRGLLRKTFTESGTRRVVSSTMVTNVASRRVLEKAGLKRQRLFAMPAFETAAVKYALSREENDLTFVLTQTPEREA
jgi:RimJ/RimL family protein N-acetyltransferase